MTVALELHSAAGAEYAFAETEFVAVADFVFAVAAPVESVANAFFVDSAIVAVAFVLAVHVAAFPPS